MKLPATRADAWTWYRDLQIECTTGKRRADVTVGVAATLLVIGVGFSRLYLGAHYPSDVLAGFAAGIVWLAACISAVEVSAPAPVAS